MLSLFDSRSKVLCLNFRLGGSQLAHLYDFSISLCTNADVVDVIHCVNCGPFFVSLAFQSRVLLGRQAPQEARWVFDSRSQGCRGHWHIEVYQHYGSCHYEANMTVDAFRVPMFDSQTIWSPFQTNLSNPPVLSKLFLRNPCVDYPYLIPCFAQEPPRPRSHGAAATQVHHVSNVDVGTCNNSWILLFCTECLGCGFIVYTFMLLLFNVFQLNCHGVFLICSKKSDFLHSLFQMRQVVPAQTVPSASPSQASNPSNPSNPAASPRTCLGVKWYIYLISLCDHLSIWLRR